MKPFVKICGLTNALDARAAVSAGADLLGFVFYAPSPRAVTAPAAAAIIRHLPKKILKVGVFVNEAPGRVKAIAQECGLDLLQFHGDEDQAYLKGFKGYRVIKAIRVAGAASFGNVARLKPDYFLFDAFQKGVMGGTGKAFDWRLLEGMVAIKTPFFISGGLSCDNVGALLGRVRPYGVDVSSGVELRPGRKSSRLMKKFIQAVKLTSCELASCGLQAGSK